MLMLTRCTESLIRLWPPFAPQNACHKLLGGTLPPTAKMAYGRFHFFCLSILHVIGAFPCGGTVQSPSVEVFYLHPLMLYLRTFRNILLSSRSEYTAP